MACSSGHCSQTAFTPEQRAAALPWGICFLGFKILWMVLVTLSMVLGYFFRGHIVFRVAIAVCAISFFLEPFVDFVCINKIKQIEGDHSKTTWLGWTGRAFSLTLRAYFAYVVFNHWVFPDSSSML